MKKIILFNLLFFSQVIIFSLDLTEEEQQWIQEHPVIRVSNETNWPPYDFHETKPEGYVIDLLELISQRIGVEFDYVTSSSWDKLIELAESKDIDLIHPLGYTESRAEFLHFTDPVLTLVPVLAVRKNFIPINTLEDMSGYKLGIISSYSYQEDLRKQYPDIHFVNVVSPVQAMTYLASGRIDGYADSLGSINYIKEKYFLTNIEVLSDLNFEEYSVLELRLGIRKDWDIFAKIVNRAVKAISEEDKVPLRRKWIYSVRDYKFYEPDAQEQALLSTKKKIKICSVQEHPPINYLNKNGYREGLLYDYFDIIEESLDVYLYEDLAECQDVFFNSDIVFPLLKNEPYPENFTYKMEIVKSPISFCYNSQVAISADFNNLAGKKIGILQWTEIEDVVKDIDGLDDVTAYRTTIEGLDALLDDQIEIFIGSSFESGYMMSKHKYSSIRTVVNAEYYISYSIMLQDSLDWLLPVLKKVVMSIDDSVRREIANKWTDFRIEKKTDWNIVLQFVFSVVLFSSLILVFFFLRWRKVVQDFRLKSAETLNIQNQQSSVQSAVAKQQKFISSLMHSIKNQINPLSGFVELMQLTPLNDKQKDYLNQIEFSRLALEEVLSRVEQYILIQNMEDIRCKEIVSLDQFVSRIDDVYTGKAILKNIDLVLKVNSGVPEYFFFCFEYLYLIISELLDNAIEYTSSGYVEIDVIDFRSPEKGCVDLEFTVSDSGTGILREVNSDIVNPFVTFKAEGSRKVGLGLAIVDALVRKLGGSLKYKSIPGKGAEFKIKLFDVRIAKMEDKDNSIREEINTEESLILFDNCKVLIADDIEYNISIIKKLLGNIGIEFFEVYNGKDVLEFVSKIKPDLIFLDMRMPLKNGFEVAEILKSKSEYSDIPLIAMSASTEVYHKVMTMRICDGYIQKPYKKNDLMNELRRFLPYTKLN